LIASTIIGLEVAHTETAVVESLWDGFDEHHKIFRDLGLINLAKGSHLANVSQISEEHLEVIGALGTSELLAVSECSWELHHECHGIHGETIPVSGREMADCGLDGFSDLVDLLEAGDQFSFSSSLQSRADC